MRYTGLSGLFVLALATFAVAPVCAADLRGTQQEAQMLQLLNADRAANGLGPLAADASLAAVARAHSTDMVQSGFFSHTSPNTGDVEQRLSRGGIAWRAYAENISFNSSVQASQASLMQSPGHRANILNPTYDTVGIGIVSNGRSLFVTQNFIKRGSGSSRRGTPVLATPAAQVPAGQAPLTETQTTVRRVIQTPASSYQIRNGYAVPVVVAPQPSSTKRRTRRFTLPLGF